MHNQPDQEDLENAIKIGMPIALAAMAVDSYSAVAGFDYENTTGLLIGLSLPDCPQSIVDKAIDLACDIMRLTPDKMSEDEILKYTENMRQRIDKTKARRIEKKEPEYKIL
jgi:hypothetical protein